MKIIIPAQCTVLTSSALAGIELKRANNGGGDGKYDLQICLLVVWMRGHSTEQKVKIITTAHLRAVCWHRRLGVPIIAASCENCPHHARPSCQFGCYCSCSSIESGENSGATDDYGRKFGRCSLNLEKLGAADLCLSGKFKVDICIAAD